MTTTCAACIIVHLHHVLYDSKTLCIKRLKCIFKAPRHPTHQHLTAPTPSKMLLVSSSFGQTHIQITSIVAKMRHALAEARSIYPNLRDFMVIFNMWGGSDSKYSHINHLLVGHSIISIVFLGWPNLEPCKTTKDFDVATIFCLDPCCYKSSLLLQVLLDFF